MVPAQQIAYIKNQHDTTDFEKKKICFFSNMCIILSVDADKTAKVNFNILIHATIKLWKNSKVILQEYITPLLEMIKLQGFY